MYSGKAMARQNKFVTAPESAFMVADEYAESILRTDVGSDGNGFTNPQNWVDHLFDGSNASGGRALLGQEGVITRTFMPRYRLMYYVLRHLCGDPSTSVLGDGRSKFVFTFPEFGAPEVETVTGYYGVSGALLQLLGGKLRSFNIDVTRNADGGSLAGNIEYHFNWLEIVSDFPNSVAQTEINQLVASGATVPGSYVLPATDIGAGGTLTVDLGMTSGQLQTAIRAIAGYNDVGVTATGAMALVGGVNAVYRLTATNVSGSATLTASRPEGDGSNTTVATGTLAAALQTALEARYGDGNIAVTGSVPAAGGGGSIISGGTPFGTSMNPANAFDGNESSTTDVMNPGDYFGYDRGAGNEITTGSFRLNVGNVGGTYSGVLEASNDNSSWTPLNTRTLQAQGDATFTFSSSTAYRWFRFRVTAWTVAGVLQVYTLNIFEASVTSGFYDLAFQGALANRVVEAPTVSGAGWSVTEQTAGAGYASEIQLLTFTNAPALKEFALYNGTSTQIILGGDSNATIAAKIQALQGGTISVSGTRSTSVDPTTGETLYSGPVIIYYGGSLLNANVPAITVLDSETQLIEIASGDSGNYTVNGSGNVTLAQSVATWQAALRLTGGNWAAVVLGGTITAPSAGANIANTATPSASAGDATKLNDGTNVWWTPGAAPPQWGKYDFGAPVAISSYELFGTQFSYAPTQWQIQYSATGVFGGEETIADNVASYTGWTGSHDTAGVRACAGTGRYWRLLVTQASDPGDLRVSEWRLFAAAAGGAAAVSVHFPYSVGNPAAGVATGTGITTPLTTVTQGGAASTMVAATTVRAGSAGIWSGSFDIEFGGALANSNVPTWPASGGTGWTATTTTPGSNGLGAVQLSGPYLEALHCRLYIADDDADLASIDVHDIPGHDGTGGDPHMLISSPGSTWAVADMWNPVYYQTGLQHAVDMVPGAMTITGNITVPNSHDPASDCQFLYNTQDHCLATGYWRKRAFVCGPRDNEDLIVEATAFEYHEDCFMSRVDGPDYAADNDVYLKTFPAGRALNPEGTGSLRFTLILPPE